MRRTANAERNKHLFERILIPSKCGIKDLIRLTEIADVVIGVIEYWENKGL